jgi:protein TonB
MMFERYVVGQHRPMGRRALLIVASLILHCVAAIALVIWSFVRVERIEPPPLTVTFFSSAAPPPPAAAAPPPAGKKNSSTPKPTKPLTQPKPELQQPPRDQPKPPEPEEPEDEGEEDGVEGGVVGGVKGGQVGGTVGGTVGGVVGGTGDGPAAPLPPVKPKNIPPHQLDNEALYHPMPHLPDVIKAQRRGTGLSIFTAKICIAQTGLVQSVTVMQGIPGADDAIVATIKQWKYKPQPIPVCFVNNFEFDVQ